MEERTSECAGVSATLVSKQEDAVGGRCGQTHVAVSNIASGNVQPDQLHGPTRCGRPTVCGARPDDVQNASQALPVQQYGPRLGRLQGYTSADGQLRDQGIRPRVEDDVANGGVIECCSELCRSADQSAAGR